MTLVVLCQYIVLLRKDGCVGDGQLYHYACRVWNSGDKTKPRETKEKLILHRCFPRPVCTPESLFPFEKRRPRPAPATAATNTSRSAAPPTLPQKTSIVFLSSPSRHEAQAATAAQLGL